MSKKDRRAIEAFGLRPRDPEPVPQGGHALLFGTGTTYTWNSWGNTNGALWVNPIGQTVQVKVGDSWQIMPGAITINAD